jgi:soluble lytic murein transglycosylase-like protein/TolA-binding protein
MPVMKEYVIYLLAKAHQNIEDINQAIKLYLEISTQYPHSSLVPSAHYQLALLYREANQEERFWQECYLAVETSAETKFKARVLTRMSDILWEEEQYLDSLTYLKEIIENRYEREKISFQEEQYINRFQVIQENGQFEIPPDLLIFFADTVFNYGRYNIAEQVYEETINKYREQIDLAGIHYKKARAIYYQGDYERAMKDCLYILDSFNNNSEQEEVIVRTLYLYAGSLLSTGNRARAAEKYKEIIKKFSANYFAQLSYLRLSEIGFLEGNQEEGTRYLKQLLIDFPSSSLSQEAAWKLSRYYTNQNDINKSLQYYQFIYEHFPRGDRIDDALYWMGKLAYPIDKKEGEKWYERLLSQFPDSYYSFRIPGELRDYSDNMESIINRCKEISLDEFKQKHFPREKGAQLSAYRAELLIFLQLYQESLQEIIYALKQEPNNLYLQFLLTQTYAEAGEYYQSISYGQTILDYLLSENNREFPVLIWKYAFPVFYEEFVKRIASSYHIDPCLVWSIMREESHFNPYAQSRAGARGLMQIVFSTGEWIAQKLNYNKFEYDSLFDPELNINLGSWYLQYLQEKFDKNTFLIISGYNAGPGITDKWVETIDMNDTDFFVENIPYQETSEHIKKVMRSYHVYQTLY